MGDVLQTFSQNEIVAIAKILSEFAWLVGITSIGVFTYVSIFSEYNRFKKNLGFSFLSSIIVFGIRVYFKDQIDWSVTFLISLIIGFCIPPLKDLFNGRKLAKIAIKTVKKTSSAADSLIESIDEELND